MTDSARRVYLDNAATSFPKPPAVVQAMSRFMTDNGAPGRGAYREARDAARAIQICRERIARLVNLARPENVVFGYNTSDALNLGVKGVLAHARRTRGPQATLHVVTTAMEHNSILRPLHGLAQRDPLITWTIVDADSQTGIIDPESIGRAITLNTVLVCVNHASNVTGTLQDLEAIGRVCAKFGAGSSSPSGVLLLVDGAQSLGHVPVDMQRMHIDLLAFPGHKGLLGPTGTGGLCIRPGVEQRLDTIREGGTGNISEVQTHPSMMPEKYEAGSHNTVGLVGLSEGVKWLLERTVETERQHEMELMRTLLDQLGVNLDGTCSAAPGLKLLGPIDCSQRVGVFSFIHSSISAQELASILEASFGVLSRAGLHCAPLAHELLRTSPLSNSGQSGAMRLSFGPFVTTDDVLHACAALAQICSEALPADPQTPQLATQHR